MLEFIINYLPLIAIALLVISVACMLAFLEAGVLTASVAVLSGIRCKELTKPSINYGTLGETKVVRRE